MSSDISTVKDLQERLSGHRIAMVTTVDERGTLSARPLTVQKLGEKGELWFLVDKNADWVTPASGSATGASIVDDGDTWVSFSGRAFVVADQNTVDLLLDSISETFLGPDAEAVALRLDTDQIEWWTAPNTVSQLVGLAKSKVTGSEPDMGDSGTIEV